MEFSENTRKSKIYCCVYGCHSKPCREYERRFYHFPREKTSYVKIINKFNEEETIDRRTAWIRVLRIGKKVTDSMRVCSVHFTEDDFILPHHGQRENSVRIHLKKTSVPPLNLPPQPTTKTPNPEKKIRSSLREERRHRRSLEKPCSINSNDQGLSEAEGAMENVDGKSKDTEQEEGYRDSVENSMADDQLMIESIAKETTSSSSKKFRDVGIQVGESFEGLGIQAEGKFKEIGIQVQSDSITPKFISFITNDSELSTLTGITSFELLTTIEELVGIIRISSNRNTRLNLRETIIMTFMKLKHNLSYAALAILFHCCGVDTCKLRIFDMIDLLNICLKPSIIWPSKTNILRNIPLSFKGFEKVRVVVDCTEIKIQRPAKLCCQLQTYSYYKTAYTLKFMTGVTPAGLISFVSKPYGGRVSDNVIFEQSGILKKMDKNDVVMADKGFTMEDLCRRNDVTLLTPFFLRNKARFTKSEALTNRNIAKARVHVERANQRLKTFAVLGGTMPICLLNKMEEIFNIICSIVNLSSPILSNERFPDLGEDK